MPRPTKYSQTTADRILSALKAGNTRVASALYAGIDYSTLKRWAASNAPFRAALDRSEAEAEVMYAATLAKSARDGDWRAALAWLERRRHDDWRERKSTDIAVAGPIEVKHTVDDDSARLLADLIAAGLNAREADSGPLA